MTSESPPPSERVELTGPGPLWRWLPRAYLVFGLALAGFSVGDLVVAVRSAGSISFGQGAVAVATVLFTVSPAVLAWRFTSKPHPRNRTRVNELAWALTPAERRAVGRALRRGDSIDPEHRPYAVAATAANRRALFFLALMPAVAWSQVTTTAAGELGSGFFWFQLGVAGVVSVAMVGSLLLQLRHERSVRAISI
ncbi:hypothetical protein [Pseudonocardia endophytica]|uniref:Uncharacterized protein n=1 Tax=Pseudonocardia endophytica TaxID=401976 RepID=A0A4R1HVA4_PSEEN|nr:hypothetical protein [Pseudonocardia endophytica]TCK24620.1 hypothetical protein EV378_0395 [Pseudonocardia endophytica]